VLQLQFHISFHDEITSIAHCSYTQEAEKSFSNPPLPSPNVQTVPGKEVEKYHRIINE
jgi:hypothetical protein